MFEFQGVCICGDVLGWMFNRYFFWHSFGKHDRILFFTSLKYFCFHFHQELKIVIEEFCPKAHVPFSIFYLFYTEPNQNCNYYYYYYFLMPIH